MEFTNQVLMMWEKQSDRINTYNCAFERWEYDPVFGPGDEIPLTKSHGQLTYAKPDKGSFKIDRASDGFHDALHGIVENG